MKASVCFFNPDMFKQKGIRARDSAGLCRFGLMPRAFGFRVYGSGFEDRCAQKPERLQRCFLQEFRNERL